MKPRTEQDRLLLYAKIAIALLSISAVLTMAVLGMDIPETLKVMTGLIIGYFFGDKGSKIN